MPFYRVWYRNNTEPLEFSTAGITRDDAILDRVLQHENIVPFVIPPANRGDAGVMAPTFGQLIEKNNLGPVRYTVDESEPVTIE